MHLSTDPCKSSNEEKTNIDRGKPAIASRCINCRRLLVCELWTRLRKKWVIILACSRSIYCFVAALCSSSGALSQPLVATALKDT